MENINAQTPDYVPVGEPKRWYHNGWFSRSFLILAGLFFFLPFIDIKCSGTKLASVKGSDMIFGSELQVEKQDQDVQDADSASAEEGDITAASPFGFPSPEMGDNKKIAPNGLAIGGFASLILAFIFTFFKKRIALVVSGGFALLSGLGLFFIQFQVHNEVETKLGPLMSFGAFTFEFTPFYWCCLMFLTLAAAFAFVRSSGPQN